MLRFSPHLCGKSLVIMEFMGRKIVPASLAAITAAAQCGPVTALVASADAKALSAEVSKFKGVSAVLCAEGAQYAHGLPEELAPLVKSAIDAGSFTHVFAATSAFGKDLIPRVAAKYGCMPLSDITKVENETTFVRQQYAGNVLATITSKGSHTFATVRGSCFDRAEATGGSGTVTEMSAPAPVGSVTWVEDIIAESDKPSLATASRVVAGGRGLKKASNFHLLEELAAPLKAAIGATRGVVDAGFCPNEMQIGQTGKSVAPALYIGVGISGAIQHVAGMKESKTIAVINNDAGAPFFQVADYGLVADLFEAVPAMTKLLTTPH